LANWKSIILDGLKSLITKFAFQKIFGAVVGGIKGFLLKLGINILWKKLIKHGLQFLLRVLEMIPYTSKAKKTAKEMENAETPDERDDAFHNLP